MNASLSEPELLFTFHYMSSPYIQPLYANGYLSVVDYYGGAWQVLWYEVSSGKLFSLPVTGLVDKDFPVAAVTDGKTVAILTEFQRMYVCDPAAGTMEFAANVDFNVQLLGDYGGRGNRIYQSKKQRPYRRVALCRQSEIMCCAQEKPQIGRGASRKITPRRVSPTVRRNK